MTIATELTKLQTNLTNSYTAVSDKGGTLPASQNFDNLPSAIGTITELKGETKIINPSTGTQTITPSAGKNGITSATVNPVTSSIDANIQAGNIKNGVQILGITGTYTGTQPTGTISITQNGTYDVTNYASADVSVSGGGTKYGMSAEDYFYSFPIANSTLDNNAPHVDMSSVSSTFSTNLMRYSFCWSRIKSCNTPYFTNDTTYVYSYLFSENKCIQYAKINTTTNPISSNYCIYYNVEGATNIKVAVVSFAPNTVVYGQYNNFLLGSSSASKTTKIKTARIDNIMRVYGLRSLAYTVFAQQQVQTIWFPDLIGISDTSSSYGSLQNFATITSKLIGVFFPKLRQIGYTTTDSSYGQMKQGITNQSKLFSDFYLPALEIIYNVNTSASNGTFYGNNGVKKFYLPMLSVIDGNGAPYVFYGCSNTEFHFGKANQAAIEATNGYSTLWGRGAGSATVYFDLINDITVDGKTYHRTQENDYMTQLTYDNKVYYRDDASRDAHNIEWKFWAWKANDNSLVFTQNPLSLVTEAVWQYISGTNWDYNDLGNITANDWRYAWTNINDANDIIYTTNQYTPSVGDPTYTKASDGKSFIVGSNITAVA